MPPKHEALEAGIDVFNPPSPSLMPSRLAASEADEYAVLRIAQRHYGNLVLRESTHIPEQADDCNEGSVTELCAASIELRVARLDCDKKISDLLFAKAG